MEVRFRDARPPNIMPYRKQQFVNGEVYHIILRGIDDNLLFKDIDDYYRGIFSIYEFNNTAPVEIWLRRKERQKEKALGRPTSQRELLVEVLAFCFMPNHIHLLLRQIREDGISKFMVKVGSGYGRYFNKKYNRKGYVFQNRFSSVHIKDETQLKVVFTYIHTNPISLMEPKWKERGIKKDPEKIMKFLENYKWSSYLDYLDIENFPSITEKNFILELINGKEGCRELVKDWIMSKKEMNKFNNLFLE